MSKILESDFKIILVGLSLQQIRTIPKNIFCIKRTNDLNELVEIYTAADVFFNPSREETMGLTTVEAMACGTPVVVSNFTAVPEVVDENCGIVSSNLDPLLLKDCIERALCGTFHTRKKAKEYEKNKQFQKYLNLYKNW